MSIDPKPVTGREAFWGDIRPTQRQLGLINASPTFVAQIHEANEQVRAGSNKPMAVRDIVGPYYYDDEGVIAFPRNYASRSDEDFLGQLSHELAHQVYAGADRAFAERYNLHPRDPDAYNNMTLWPLRAQSAAVLNHWKIGNEILRNTAAAGKPGTDIKGNLPSGFGRLLDDESARNAKAGLTQTQNEKRLVIAGMQHLAPEESSEGTGSEYSGFGRMSGAAPIEPGDPVAVTFGDDGRGGIASMSERWKSGDLSTQIFKDGKIQSSQTVDPSGNRLRAASYTHNRDGSYSVDVKNGAGRTIQQSAFNADGSGVERGYRPDGSRRETRFNARNETTRMTAYDARGNETQKDFFDPDAGVDTNRIVTRPDGSRTLYSFNDRGKIGLQTDFGADGKRVANTAYDSDTGRVTHATRYRSDGSATVDTVGADGKGMRVVIDQDGKRLPAQAVTFSPAAQRSFEARSKVASTIAPPQPVGADDALGGQQNYFDPANNRLTNHIVTHPDGSRTLTSFNDKNRLGVTVNFNRDGRRTVAKAYDSESGWPATLTTYAADGSRSVIALVGSGFSVLKTYNAQNQLTHEERLGQAQETPRMLGPSRGWTRAQPAA
jgi:hypothetical protein